MLGKVGFLGCSKLGYFGLLLFVLGYVGLVYVRLCYLGFIR